MKRSESRKKQKEMMSKSSGNFFSKLFSSSKTKRPEESKSPYQKLQEKKKEDLKKKIGTQPSRIQDKKGNVKFAGGGDSKTRKYNKVETPTMRPKKSEMPTPRPKAKKDFGMGMVDDLSKAKVKQGPPPPPAKQKKSGFFDRIKSDFNKAVSETKRNFQGDAKKKTGRYKSVNERNLDSKGNYKGTNIKPTKLQESRMKKPEKNTMDFGAKKKKATAPMYESKGTKGGVKKSKYYSGGGTVFTGR